MSRRGENIYKRKDGRWEGRVMKLDGKYQYLYATSYKEVKEKMRCFREHHKPLEQGNLYRSRNAEGLLKSWLEGDVCQRVKPSTYESYYYCMHKYVLPFFKRSGNEHMTEDSVCRFVKTVWEDTAIAASSKKKILSIFKAALRKILKNFPEYLFLTELIKIPKAGSKEVQAFSMQEQRLIESTALNWKDQRALGIVLCFYSGIRLGELCALKWSDIDLETGTMSISRTVSRTKNFRPGKNKTQLLVGPPKSKSSLRKIPLPAFLLNMMGKNKKCNSAENNYIFSDKDIPMDARLYQRLYKKVLKQSGVKDRKFHAIRHTFATRALEMGVDIKTLSEILGHSSAGITLNIYAHSLMEQKKLAIKKFDELHVSSMQTAVCAVDSAVTEVTDSLPAGIFS